MHFSFQIKMISNERQKKKPKHHHSNNKLHYYVTSCPIRLFPFAVEIAK